MTTAAEKRYLGRVAALPCTVCTLLGQPQATRTEVHHAREGQGLAQRGGNYCVIALCTDHHRGPSGIHGDRTYMRLLKVNEMDLLNLTIERLNA